MKWIKQIQCHKKRLGQINCNTVKWYQSLNWEYNWEYWAQPSLTATPGGGGGGGGVTHHMTSYAPTSKERWKGVFIKCPRLPFSLTRDVFFIFHRTLGVPGSKNFRSILGYHFQCHNNQNKPFMGASVTWCSMPFRVHFVGWWRGWVAHLQASQVTPP